MIDPPNSQVKPQGIAPVGGMVHLENALEGAPSSKWIYGRQLAPATMAGSTQDRTANAFFMMIDLRLLVRDAGERTSFMYGGVLARDVI
jgi:hypothetical protein